MRCAPRQASNRRPRGKPLATCVDHHIETLGLHLLLVPVNKCAGVVSPLANEVLIAFALVVAEKVLDHELLVNLDAHVLLNLGVKRVDVAGPHGVSLSLLEDDNVGPELSSLDTTDDTSIAATHDNNLVVLGCTHLIGNTLRLGVPCHLSLGRLSLLGQGNTRHTSGDNARGSRTSHELTTGNILLHNASP